MCIASPFLMFCLLDRRNLQGSGVTDSEIDSGHSFVFVVPTELIMYYHLYLTAVPFSKNFGLLSSHF